MIRHPFPDHWPRRQTRLKVADTILDVTAPIITSHTAYLKGRLRWIAGGSLD
jgi:hypothetical protein